MEWGRGMSIIWITPSYAIYFLLIVFLIFLFISFFKLTDPILDFDVSGTWAGRRQCYGRTIKSASSTLSRSLVRTTPTTTSRRRLTMASSWNPTCRPKMYVLTSAGLLAFVYFNFILALMFILRLFHRPTLSVSIELLSLDCMAVWSGRLRSTWGLHFLPSFSLPFFTIARWSITMAQEALSGKSDGRKLVVWFATTRRPDLPIIHTKQSFENATWSADL